MTPVSFFWDSDLTEERKAEICAWFNALPESQQKFVEELQNDERARAAFDFYDGSY